MKGRDFVIISIQSWDIPIGSNCKNIALELSKKNRVLYVNLPLDRFTKFKSKNTQEVRKRVSVIQGKAQGLEAIHENLWTYYPDRLIESINRIPPSPLYTFLNKRNNEIIFDQIRKVVAELGFSNLIFFNDSVMFNAFYAVELLKPSVSLYYIRDYLVMQPYFKRHGERMEPELASKYDAVVGNSTFLVDYLKAHNPHSYMIGQGCDLSQFDPSVSSPVPEDIRTLKKPVIGYVGFITGLRLDFDLIAHLARERPDYSIVLVGPEDEYSSTSELHSIDNVYFLGSKNEDELAMYIREFDVAINPQVVNMMTIGNYPRKIDEYLAMGKATVATKTKAMGYFEEFVYLGSDREEFLKNIDLALKEDSEALRKGRIAFARSHSWEASVEKIYEVVKICEK